MYDVCAIPTIESKRCKVKYNELVNVSLVVCEKLAIHVYLDDKCYCVLQLPHTLNTTIVSVEILKRSDSNDQIELLICTESGLLYCYPIDFTSNVTTVGNTHMEDIQHNEEDDDELFSEDFGLTTSNKRKSDRITANNSKRTKVDHDTDTISFSISLDLNDFNIRVIDSFYLVCDFQSQIQSMHVFIGKSKGKGRKVVSLSAFSFSNLQCYHISDLKRSSRKNAISFETSRLNIQTINSKPSCTAIIFSEETRSDHAKCKFIPEHICYLDDGLYQYLFGKEMSLIKSTVCIFGETSGTISYCDLNVGEELNTNPLVHLQGEVLFIREFSISGKTNDSIAFVTSNGQIYCIFKYVVNDKAQFLHRTFNVQYNITHCEIISNQIVLNTELNNVIICQLTEKNPDGTLLLPFSFSIRELPVTNNVFAFDVVTKASEVFILTLHTTGDLIQTKFMNREEIDKYLSMNIPLDSIQQGIKRFFTMIEDIQNQQNVLDVVAQNQNSDIESLNVAMHVLSSLQDKINLDPIVAPIDANAHSNTNIRQIQIILKNKSGFNLIKNWNVLVTMNEEGKEDSGEVECFCFPLNNFMMDMEWKQTVTKTLKSYLPIKILIHLCFKMKSHEKGKYLLIEVHMINSI
jgi:hypothetical protein